MTIVSVNFACDLVAPSRLRSHGRGHHLPSRGRRAICASFEAGRAALGWEAHNRGIPAALRLAWGDHLVSAWRAGTREALANAVAESLTRSARVVREGGGLFANYTDDIVRRCAAIASDTEIEAALLPAIEVHPARPARESQFLARRTFREVAAAVRTYLAETREAA